MSKNTSSNTHGGSIASSVAWKKTGTLATLREVFRRRRFGQVISLIKLCGIGVSIHYLIQRALNLPIVSLRLPDIAEPVYMRPGTSDWTALRHVLEERDCDVPLADEPRFIVDGGANIGLASVLLANKYPNAKILAVEPHGDNAVLASLNCRGYPERRTCTKRDLEFGDTSGNLQSGFVHSWGISSSRSRRRTAGEFSCSHHWRPD